MGQRTHSLDGAKREYIRAYQHVTDLRIYAVFRTSEHTLFYGQGIQDDAFGELESGTTLTKLEHKSITHGDFDILETDPFEASLPYTLYVVNPNDEAGQASNAITFDESDQIPVLDVRVDGKSVVTDQIAYIDLSGKLDVVASPDKLYGTDSDGRQHMYDLKEVMGVQHIYLNGEELEVIDNSVHIDGVAMDSDVVHKVTTPNVIYATDASGKDTTISVDHFATSSDMTSITNRVTKIEGTLPNKQDKDPDAVNGNIAIFQNGQTVDGGTSLQSINSTLQSHGDRITALEGDVTEIRQDISDINVTIGGIQSDIGSIDSELENSLAKDWKATSGGHAILNHPVSNTTENITITNRTVDVENSSYRGLSRTVVVSASPSKAGSGSVVIGSGNNDSGNSVNIGNDSTTASGSIAIGGSANAASSAVVVGGQATASANGTAIGYQSSATGSSSVALGRGSLATEADTVSVGFDDTSGRSPVYRRIVAVADPKNAHDAATKAYVNSEDSGATNHPISHTGDIDSLRTPGVYGCISIPSGQHPSSFNDSCTIIVYPTTNDIGNGNKVQIAFDANNTNAFAIRHWTNGAWNAWTTFDWDTITSLQNTVSSLQTTLSSLQNTVTQNNTKLNQAISSIVNKVYGGGEFDSNTGSITWPNTSKIPVGDLNIFSVSNPSDSTYANSIRSRSLKDADIRVQ